MRLHSKYLSGIVAIGIYLFIIGLVFYYFGYHSSQKSKHFVTKNSNAISVSLAGAPSPKKPPQVHHKSKPKPKTKPKPKHIKPKPIKSKKPTKTIKKPAKKPAKRIKPKNLFSTVKTSPKTKPKSKKSTNTPKPQKSKGTTHGKSSIKNNKKADKGIENKYLADVQNKLYGWPAQSNFAGAKMVIGLTIHPNGSFEYEVLQLSSNPEYNRVIQQYLKQLKPIGFGPTPSGKTYKFKVDIVAK
jgi:outer membrane biosynthesis protein TonB